MRYTSVYASAKSVGRLVRLNFKRFYIKNYCDKNYGYFIEKSKATALIKKKIKF